MTDLRSLPAFIAALWLAIMPARAMLTTTQLHGFNAGSGSTSVALTRGTCVNSTSDTNAYTFNATGTGAAAGASVFVVAGVIGEDSTTTFTVDNVTFDGVAGSEIVDQGGTEVVTAAIWGAPATATGNDSVDIVVTFSESIIAAAVCLWALENLSSTTPDSSVADSDGSGGALVLTLSSTTAGGFAVGISTNNATDESTTWANLTEREDTQNADVDYSNADAATTGGSLAVTSDWSGTNDQAGAAAAFR